jgi:deazaflavin-dependent oxidoreductase (nitroreductase family)
MAYLKPGFVMARVMNPLLMRFGLKPTLAVRGRRSGEWRTVPVNVLELGGVRYLVAIRGETEWVRNLRAAGAGELRWRDRVDQFTAEELPVDERAPIIAAYREHWEREAKKLFDQLPDPADHPVFRLSG